MAVGPHGRCLELEGVLRSFLDVVEEAKSKLRCGRWWAEKSGTDARAGGLWRFLASPAGREVAAVVGEQSRLRSNALGGTERLALESTQWLWC